MSRRTGDGGGPPTGDGARARWARRSPLLVVMVATPFLVCGALLADEFFTPGLAAAVALGTAVLAAGRAVALRLLPPDAPAASAWSAAAVVATVLLVLPALALGHLGYLDPRFYLLVEALLALVLAGLLPSPVAAPRPATPTLTWLRRGEDACLFAAAAVALLALGFAVSQEFHQPVHKLDDPSYHMITVATWLQHGDLRMPHLHHGDPATAYYPIAGEVIDWALVAPLRDSDVVARWAQFPYFVALLLAVAAVARRLGATPRTAAVAALLLCTPRRLLPDLALSAANDLMLAFFVVAAVDATLAWRRAYRDGAGGERPRAAVLGPAIYCGAALGLAVGTKYLGVLLAPAVVLAVVLLPLGLQRRSGAAGALRRHLPGLAAAGGVAVLVGGYTYLRNWVSVGNPLFPFPLELGPLRFPGWHQSTLAFRSALPEFAIDPFLFLVDRPVFTGITYYVTLLPAAVLGPLVWWVRRWRRGADDTAVDAHRVLGWPVAWVLLLPAAIYLLFVFRVYDHREVRYLFAALALAAVAYSWLVERLPQRWRPWVRAATAVAIAAGIPANHPKQLYLYTAASFLITGACFGVGLVAGWFASPRLGRPLPPTAHRPGLAIAVVATLLAAVLAVAPAARYYTYNRHDGDPVLAQLIGDSSGVAVRVTGGNKWYDLFGRRLENRVVPVEATTPEAVHYTWGGRDVLEVMAEEAAAAAAEWAAAHPGADPATAPPLWARRLAPWEKVVVYDGSEAARHVAEHPADFHRLATGDDRTLWLCLPESATRHRGTPP